jgi:hypothetical protein
MGYTNNPDNEWFPAIQQQKYKTNKEKKNN